MAGKKTLVLGATDRRDKYANLAIRKLRDHGHDVIAVGARSGTVDDVTIVTAIPSGIEVDTVTLYLNPFNQEQYRQQILDLNPKRIIFNPGTENTALQVEAKELGIEPVTGCTLVMLSVGTY